MERDLNNGDFEEFLRQKSDQYKIYPSEQVWKAVYKTLHTRKRWFRIGGSLLFLSALLFINYQFPANRAVPATTVKPAEVHSLPASERPEQKDVKNLFVVSSVVKTAIPGRRRISAAEEMNMLQDQQANKNPVQPGGPQTEEAMVHVANNVNTATPASDLIKTDVEEGSGIAGDIIAVPATQLQHMEMGVEADNETMEHNEEINWLQEMAVIKLTPSRRQRFNLQFYFSPTVSYRKLNDGNKSGNIRNLPLASSHLGVNYFVDHKPSVGIELGSNILFSPAKNLTLKTGLQMNYSRYNIKAYKFYFEKANIALTTVGPVADTMSSYTSIRNQSGYSPEALQNQYVQVSLPVGAELMLLSGKKVQVHIAGTLQPTYLIYNDTYLLSTDYINYIKEPSLVRKWNLHTSAEAFISYYVGSMRWQVGPQFRYQVLSSYHDRYPIKEYLIEYGVKFGVSKTLK